MSKRDALRQLIRKYPPPTELKAIIEGLSNEPDRSAAIIAAAILEGMLERMILHRLAVKDDPGLIGQLFTNRGPLSDLHSKILVARAFGFIGANAAADMNRIKAIRNVFAHAAHAVSFDTPEIDREVRGFIILDAIYDASTKEVIGGGPVPLSIRYPNKVAYVLTVHLMCIIHDHWHQEKGGEPILQIYEKFTPAPLASSPQK
jgi:DNA-binding MltR family transcriptional regulator